MSRPTIDLCAALWSKLGRKPFYYDEVKEHLKAPSQLRAMELRGYAVRLEEGHGRHRVLWQLTENARMLYEEMQDAAAEV